MGSIIDYIFIGFMSFIAILFVWTVIHSIKIKILFKDGRNPYSRVCKHCNAHQDQYRSNVEGYEHQTWWAEVYPIGNDEKCECHKYSQDRDW